MKIIVETEKDKQDLLAVSKYLHDFRVSRWKGVTKAIKPNGRFFKIKEDEMIHLELESEMGNALRHIYMAPEVIQVEGK